MKLTRYKNFIIVNTSIWFDTSDYTDSRSFMVFKTSKQAMEFIDDFNKKYEFINETYKLRDATHRSEVRT